MRSIATLIAWAFAAILTICLSCAVVPAIMGNISDILSHIK